MWRCASKSLRKTFKGSVSKCNPILSTNAFQCKEANVLKLTPCFIERCSRFFNNYQGFCENFSNDKNNKRGPKDKKSSFINCFHDKLDACLSGVVAIVSCSYYGYCKYKRLFFVSDVHEKKQCPVKVGCYKTLEYLYDAVKFNSYNCVLPEVQASKFNSSKAECSSSSSLKSEELNFRSLEVAHQKILGTLSNWVGNQYMLSGQHKEAVKYFSQSAEEEHAPGIFNLGICHEKGYGTTQNFTKAAELYQRAAELGHPTAMYNLGVFYAQGIGGIEPDINYARELFKTAAGLGQADAAKALNMEKEIIKPLLIEPKTQDKNKSSLSDVIFSTLLDQSLIHSLGNFNVHDESSDCESFEYTEADSSGSDSGVLDLSPHNEPSVLLI